MRLQLVQLKLLRPARGCLCQPDLRMAFNSAIVSLKQLPGIWINLYAPQAHGSRQMELRIMYIMCINGQRQAPNIL